MPELPEVETIRRGLEGKIVGQTIVNADCDSPRHLNYSLNLYRKKIMGAKVLAVRRRAKMLYFELSDKRYLAIHLKMTGQLVFRHKKTVVIGGHPIKDGDLDLPNKFTHVIFYFKSGDVLYFNDTRKFGWARLLNHQEFTKELARLGYGPEPMTDDFEFDYFVSILKKYPNRKIKQTLLDQQLIAGLGNIYADEVCYFAKVRPQRKVSTLKPGERKLLFDGIKKILPKAVKYGGSSIATHLNAFGRKGSYSQFHIVYARYGEPCEVCGTELKRITVAGRTSTYCPKEQR